MKNALGAAIVSVMLGLCATPAANADADSADPSVKSNASDILGQWGFQTKPYRGGSCVMSGTLHLSPDGEDGVYGCELTALEICSLWGQSIVRQSCTARRFGNQLSIRSQIEEILETKSHLDGFQLNYVPDNFALTIRSADRMYGALVSAVTAPVEFHRTSTGVS